MADKVYNPEVIPDNPFTGDLNQLPGTEPRSIINQIIAAPAELQYQPFPRKKIAMELLSVSLNTKTKKILKEFQFTPSGAIQIGDFTLGITGDIRISPDGIVARNNQGEITFALDGDSGDAVFKGTIQAGSLISGSLLLGGQGNGSGIFSLVDENNAEIVHMDNTGIIIYDGKLTIISDAAETIIDSKGIKSTTQFLNASVTQASTQNTTSTSFVDVPGVSQSFSLDRIANVLITLDATGNNTGNLAGADNNVVCLNVDGVNFSKQMSLPGSVSGNGSTLFGVTGSLTFLVQLGAGSHTIKMRFRSVNGGTAGIAFATLTYSVLGR